LKLYVYKETLVEACSVEFCDIFPVIRKKILHGRQEEQGKKVKLSRYRPGQALGVPEG
jgi:hypothetical protein